MIVSLLLVPAAIAYLLVLGALYVYGINFYYLTYLAVRHSRAVRLPPAVEQWPKVTVQLPIYNEMHVARRVIEAAAAIDYPPHLLEIQVLDDSTDETAAIAAQVVVELQAAGVSIFHVQRAQRDGYKAGALRDGLKSAQGDFIAIFDADFIPSRSFLKRTIPYFQDDEIAFVQARWDHTNRDYSLLTYLQSLSIDGHFMVEQFSRNQGGYWFNFNGTAGVWRKEAIDDAGGWQPRTLTEDLDLSYRAFLKGWRAIYLRDIAVPAEIPLTFSAYRRQQHRWARGSLETAAILIPKVWASDFPLRMKVEATLHMTGYVVHLLLFASCFVYPLVAILSARVPGLETLFGIGFVFSLAGLAPTLFFTVAQIQLKRSWWQTIPAVLFTSAFGIGMMLNTVRAALEIVRVKDNQFERTPKYGVTLRDQSWKHSSYRLKLDPIIFWEIAFGLLNLASSILAFHYRQWFISFYTLIFAVGLIFDSLYTATQSLQMRRST